MNCYRLTLRPLGSWATPWHADSLFGALCWKRYEARGDNALKEWLDAFRSGQPAFVLSDAFPAGLLPAPQGCRYKIGERKATRPHWISEFAFRALAAGACATDGVELHSAAVWTDATKLMASLGRDAASAEFGGALFEQQATSAVGMEAKLHVYFRADSPDGLLEAFRLLTWTGFGRKSSSGFGAFLIEGEPELCPWLDSVPGANGYIALGHFVPATADPVDGRWRTHVKYPKYHSHAVSHPFKGRLTTLVPGSWFRTPETVRPWYGQMVEMPVDGLPVLHYGLALPAPCVLPFGALAGIGQS